MSVKIGFICTGNSARSQIAEGFGKYYAEKLKKSVEVYSAGSNPSDYIHPLAVKVMKEKGIDISKNIPKSLDEIPLKELDYVITLCDDAEENCPIVIGAKKLHWGFPDPAKVKEKQLNVFKYIRDEIEKKVEELIKKI